MLARIFNDREGDRPARREFVQSFRQATSGREEKALERSLDLFIGEYRGHYQVLPTASAWGQETTIWPQGSPWLRPPGDLSAVEILVNQRVADLKTGPGL